MVNLHAQHSLDIERRLSEANTRLPGAACAEPYVDESLRRRDILFQSLTESSRSRPWTLTKADLIEQVSGELNLTTKESAVS